jgi:hypothetical protein
LSSLAWDLDGGVNCAFESFLIHGWINAVTEYFPPLRRTQTLIGYQGCSS